jgi:hypothetical protein
MTTKILVGTFLLLIIFAGCNQPFDPRGPLDQEMAIFTILSTDRDVQFVRVGASYMPPGFDPATYTSDNAVRDAFVTIKGPGKIYQMRDTLLSRLDTSRYKFPFHLYTLNPFTPQHGATYEVIVQSLSLGTASAFVVVPGEADISINLYSTYQVLSNPLLRGPDEQAVFSTQFSTSAKAYLARLYIYYDVLKGSQWVEERVEVPTGTADEIPYSLNYLIYPKLTLCPQSAQTAVTYKNGFMRNLIKRLTTVTYENDKIIYKWIVLVVLQVDENLFSYYNAVHEYQDPRSIRLDQPLYAKLNGGIGFAGAYALDSLVYILPADFSGNR